MNTKIIVGAIVGAIASFLLGWVVYGMLLMDFFKANATVYEGLMKDPPVLWAIFASGLCITTLLAWLFSKLGITTFMKGATTAFVIAFLLTLWYYLLAHAFMNLYNTTLMMTDILVGSVFNAVIGGIIAMVMGKVGNKSAATA